MNVIYSTLPSLDELATTASNYKQSNDDSRWDFILDYVDAVDIPIHYFVRAVERKCQVRFNYYSGTLIPRIQAFQRYLRIEPIHRPPSKDDVLNILPLACQIFEPNEVKQLLAPLTPHDIIESGALKSACEAERPEIVRVLLEAGITPEKIIDTGVLDNVIKFSKCWFLLRTVTDVSLKNVIATNRSDPYAESVDIEGAGSPSNDLPNNHNQTIRDLLAEDRSDPYTESVDIEGAGSPPNDLPNYHNQTMSYLINLIKSDQYPESVDIEGPEVTASPNLNDDNNQTMRWIAALKRFNSYQGSVDIEGAEVTGNPPNELQMIQDLLPEDRSDSYPEFVDIEGAWNPPNDQRQMIRDLLAIDRYRTHPDFVDFEDAEVTGNPQNDLSAYKRQMTRYLVASRVKGAHLLLDS